MLKCAETHWKPADPAAMQDCSLRSLQYCLQYKASVFRVLMQQPLLHSESWNITHYITWQWGLQYSKPLEEWNWETTGHTNARRHTHAHAHLGMHAGTLEHTHTHTMPVCSPIVSSLTDFFFFFKSFSTFCFPLTRQAFFFVWLNWGIKWGKHDTEWESRTVRREWD